MISSSKLNKLGKVGLKKVTMGKVSDAEVMAESLWKPNPVTVIFAVRRPGMNDVFYMYIYYMFHIIFISIG